LPVVVRERAVWVGLVLRLVLVAQALLELVQIWGARRVLEVQHSVLLSLQALMAELALVQVLVWQEYLAVRVVL
tara:strand:+ start:2853 stop:3074 length:222 start_codon:yes stop_codon:yes gene_type:complete